MVARRLQEEYWAGAKGGYSRPHVWRKSQQLPTPTSLPEIHIFYIYYPLNPIQHPDFIFTGNQIALIFGTNLFNFHPLQCRVHPLQYIPPANSETIFPTMGDHFISLVNLYPEFIFTTNQSDWIRLYSQPHAWGESLQLPPPTIRGKRCRAHIPSTNSDSIFTTMGDNINPY